MSDRQPKTIRLADYRSPEFLIDHVDLTFDLAARGTRVESITGLPDQCSLTLVCRVDPVDNTTLDGLYQSSGNFCTQCEAEGFRRITYFPDRPDVLSRYRVTLVADKATCPVLLSNGNPVESR
ncbi:MAG: aminopeptidase N, partial [Thioalkalivibrio sp.]